MQAEKLQNAPTPETRCRSAAIDGRSQGKGGAARSASLMRDEAAPGPLTQASAPLAPGRLGREGAKIFGGVTP